MHIAVDVHYAGGGATAAGVLFPDWRGDTIARIVRARRGRVAPYAPGRFFERELPVILDLLAGAGPVETVLVDGYAVLPGGRDGLGAHLSRALDLPVIGVAKTAFRDTPPAWEVRRGGSARPLFVTAAGIDADRARELVRDMHGPHRIPTLLAAADRASRA